MLRCCDLPVALNCGSLGWYNARGGVTPDGFIVVLPVVGTVPMSLLILKREYGPNLSAPGLGPVSTAMVSMRYQGGGGGAWY